MGSFLGGVGSFASGVGLGVAQGLGYSPDVGGSGLSFLAGNALGSLLTSPIQLAANVVGGIGSLASAAFPSGIGSAGGLGAPGGLLADNSAGTVSDVPTLKAGELSLFNRLSSQIDAAQTDIAGHEQALDRIVGFLKQNLDNELWLSGQTMNWAPSGETTDIGLGAGAVAGSYFAQLKSLEGDRSFLLQRAERHLDALTQLDRRLDELRVQRDRISGFPGKHTYHADRFQAFDARVKGIKPSRVPSFRPLDRKLVP